MNICVLRHSYFPEDPRLRKEVYALLEKGYAVDIICLRKPGELRYEVVNGARVYRIPLQHMRKGVVRYFIEYSLSFIMMGGTLSSLFLSRRYDCVQVNTMPDGLVFSTIIPRLSGARVVLDLHEPTPELWVTKYGSKRLRALLYFQIKIEQLAIRYADHCITVTEPLRRRFAERGAPLSKITVVSNACAEGTFDRTCESQGHGSDKLFRLVTHGLIEKRYGHDLVVEAISTIKASIPNLMYEVYGSGGNQAAVEKLAGLRGCAHMVRFFGHLPMNQLLRNLEAADVAVVPMQRSPYSELTDTTKMYEYIALRKPIIISRLTAVLENFDDSCMMFFEPGNADDLARCILALWKDQARRQSLVENASRRYESLRWRKTKETYCAVIEGSTR